MFEDIPVEDTILDIAFRLISRGAIFPPNITEYFDLMTIDYLTKNFAIKILSL